jgi:hypothetical protein
MTVNNGVQTQAMFSNAVRSEQNFSVHLTTSIKQLMY